VLLLERSLLVASFLVVCPRFACRLRGYEIMYGLLATVKGFPNIISSLVLDFSYTTLLK